MTNLSEYIDRHDFWSKKWDKRTLVERFTTDDILPLWIADMDFKAPEPIIHALSKLVHHGIFGYSVCDDANNALIEWMEKYHHCHVIQPEWIVNTPGVVYAIKAAVQTYTKPGDNVLIQRPVYNPFFEAIEINDRIVVSSAMIQEGRRYRIDFDDFEKKAALKETTLAILCSPHNPLSRVYTQEELERLLEICRKHDVVVVMDEIHGDWAMPDSGYISALNLAPEYYEHLVICLSPSKTFNLAGTQWSGVVIPDDTMREAYALTIEQAGYECTSPFAVAAVTAAYRECEDWLEAVKAYVYDNYLYVKETLESGIPGVQLIDLEATYMAFIDFNALGIDNEELIRMVYQDAKVALNAGSTYGPEGKGFMRMNLASPRVLIEEAVRRLVDTFQSR